MQSVQDTVYWDVQELEDILNTPNSTLPVQHKEAIAFLNDLIDRNARNTVRLHSLCNRPAAEAVEDMASEKHASGQHSSNIQDALKTCSPNMFSSDHCNPCSVSKKPVI